MALLFCLSSQQIEVLRQRKATLEQKLRCCPRQNNREVVLHRVVTLPPIGTNNSNTSRQDEIQRVLLARMKQDLGGLSDNELKSLELDGQLPPPVFRLPAAAKQNKNYYDLARVPKLAGTTSLPNAELGQALESLESIEARLRACASQAARRIKTKDPRAVEVLKKLAAVILNRLLTEAAASVVRLAFAQWNVQIDRLSRETKTIAYRRYQGSRRLCWYWYRKLRRDVRGAWMCWMHFVLTRRKLEREVARYNVALALQCAWRSLRAKNERRSRLRQARAVRLQAWTRSFTSRHAYLAYRLALKRKRAALTIQNSVFRTVRARSELARLTAERALLILQCWWRVQRARLTRTQAQRVRDRHRAVALVQRVTRGMAGRRLAADRKDVARRDAVVRRIQRPLKAFIKRRIAIREFEMRAEQSARLLAYAVRMQALFRGNRSRAINELRRRRGVMRRRKYAQAAVSMQKCARRFTALRRARRLRAEREAIAESADVDRRGERAERNAAFKRICCSECENAVASRLCDQCQDRFCAACFVEVHSSSWFEGGKRRREHTHVVINVAECSECDQEVASVFCRNCDDYFCSACFERLHVGRSNHVTSELRTTALRESAFSQR